MVENPNRKVEKLLPEERLGGNGLFARITVFPGREIDYHEHHGKTETYHIISGEGVYSDNGAERAVHAGDTVFCDDGGGPLHGVHQIVPARAVRPVIHIASQQYQQGLCQLLRRCVDNAACLPGLFQQAIGNGIDRTEAILLIGKIGAGGADGFEHGCAELRRAAGKAGAEQRQVRQRVPACQLGQQLLRQIVIHQRVDL